MIEEHKTTDLDVGTCAAVVESSAPNWPWSTTSPSRPTTPTWMLSVAWAVRTCHLVFGNGVDCTLPTYQVCAVRRSPVHGYALGLDTIGFVSNNLLRNTIP